MTERAPTLALSLALLLVVGCGGDDPLDAGRDAGVADGGGADAGATDGGEATDGGDAGGAGTDASSGDASVADAGDADAGGGSDGGGMDAGAADAGFDGGPGVTCTEPGLTTETIRDSASVGTPDTYFRDVRPGDPFCAEITGGGSGSWGVTVSNGTTTGVYCRDVPRCAIRVPPGDTTLLVTAITSDIGFYTLTIHRIPP